MVIILGVILGLDSKTGAAVMDLTPTNFRQILSRSRSRLKNFMSTTCHLVKKNAPCVCRLKISELVEQGYRHPDQLVYKEIFFDRRVREVVRGKVTRFLSRFFYPFHDLFRSQPYWQAPHVAGWLQKILEEKEFQEMLHLDVNRI
jgi:hypothetical protein